MHKKIEEDFRIIGNTPKTTLLIYQNNPLIYVYILHYLKGKSKSLKEMLVMLCQKELNILHFYRHKH